MRLSAGWPNSLAGKQKQVTVNNRKRTDAQEDISRTDCHMSFSIFFFFFLGGGGVTSVMSWCESYDCKVIYSKVVILLIKKISNPP